FSGRRRHTRFSRDWSSDVCSSDLHPEHITMLEEVRVSLERPLPPVSFGTALAGHAHAAIDISDGLLQDLNHILKASACAAHIDRSEERRVGKGCSTRERRSVRKRE